MNHYAGLVIFFMFALVWISKIGYSHPGNRKKNTAHNVDRVLLCQTIFFAERDASSRFEVLAQVAEEIKGKGTIAYINCGYVVFK